MTAGRRRVRRYGRVLLALLIAAALTALAASGLLYVPDNIVSDALYQRPRALSDEAERPAILIAGIDQRALDVLGPLPWPRDYMADAIGWLNADPAARPAVIGIDVLYVGESGESGADRRLAEAAALGGNVVVASAGTFGEALVRTEDGGFYMDTRALLAWERPYPALDAAAWTGHINAMADADGVLRHALLYVDVPGLGRVPSFARVIYERWCAFTGHTPGPAPQTAEDGFYYLPFTAAPGGYTENISILDLMDGSLDPARFRDRIVLIGPCAAGLQDAYITAQDHARPMYGVEIQANAIDAFRFGRLAAEARNAPQLAVTFLICALAVLYFRERQVARALAVWLAACGLWIGACALLYSRGGLVLHVLWVPLFLTILFIGSVAANYIRSQRERRRLKDTFGRYVDPAILRQLLEIGGDELELGGRMCEIAVLFVDIRGFTTMSESLDPPTVVEIINMYLTLTTECIMRWHGTLDKFVGDCTMAFWNAPLPQADPVYLACCAAMDMVEGSKALGETLFRRFGRTVSFGIGVHVGPAVVGNIGAPRRMDYTAIGDTVNTSSRLESNAPAGTVYISRAVADALGPRAKTTSLGGSVRLKGKAEGFEVLTLDALERPAQP